MLGAIQIAQIMPAAASFEIEFPVLRWTSLLRGVPRRLEVAEGMCLFAYPLGWNGFLSCVHCKGKPRKPYEQVTELSSIIFSSIIYSTKKLNKQIKTISHSKLFLECIEYKIS